MLFALCTKWFKSNTYLRRLFANIADNFKNRMQLFAR